MLNKDKVPEKVYEFPVLYASEINWYTSNFPSFTGWCAIPKQVATSFIAKTASLTSGVI